MKREELCTLQAEIGKAIHHLREAELATFGSMRDLHIERAGECLRTADGIVGNLVDACSGDGHEEEEET